MLQPVWTEQQVIAAIRGAVAIGHEINYSHMLKQFSVVLRAAERIFGSWDNAVTAAGFDYTTVRKYRRWTRERIIEKIRAWHAQGADLSWRHVSKVLDPPLAAAALRNRCFLSWEAALQAAGLTPEQIARYQKWSRERIIEEMCQLSAQGIPLNRGSLAQESPALLAAIYYYQLHRERLAELPQLVYQRRRSRKPAKTSD